jgi:hypothetical protein
VGEVVNWVPSRASGFPLAARKKSRSKMAPSLQCRRAGQTLHAAARR